MPSVITSLLHRPPSPNAGKIDVTARLQNNAARLLLATLAPGEERGTSRILEHLPNSFAGSSRALEVLLGTNLLGNSHTLRASPVQNRILARALSSRTSSGVTGLWFVFLSSSITLGSRRRSFLQATRIIGRPGQKCMTSEIHCITLLAEKAVGSGMSHTPSPERCPASQGSQLRSRSI